MSGRGRGGPSLKLMVSLAMVPAVLMTVAACGAVSTGVSGMPTPVSSQTHAGATASSSTNAAVCPGAAEAFARQHGTIDRVVAGYDVTGRRAARWEATRGYGDPPNHVRFLSGVDPSALVALCVLQGSFDLQVPWPPNVKPHPFPWSIVTVIGRRAQFYWWANSDIWDTSGL